MVFRIHYREMPHTPDTYMQRCSAQAYSWYENLLHQHGGSLEKAFEALDKEKTGDLDFETLRCSKPVTSRGDLDVCGVVGFQLST